MLPETPPWVRGEIRGTQSQRGGRHRLHLGERRFCDEGLEGESGYQRLGSFVVGWEWRFTKKIGCEMDLSDKPVGLGVHSKRYALLAEDGVVKLLNLQEGGAFTFSAAEDVLKVL
ncbi:hypothetical protein GQ457_01G028070 [Hibiscus cannabinus]